MTQPPGLDLHRVAQIFATDRAGRVGCGSGYRVTSSSVLTAAHVVAGAVSVRALFDADVDGTWSAEVTVAWSDPAGDLAVLTIPATAQPGPVDPVQYGRVSVQPGQLPCRAIGFPRFKLRDDTIALGPDDPPTRYRDTAQVDGTIPTGSNRREGTLSVAVTPPEHDAEGHSPWEGMSGAAVWSGPRIIAVVVENFEREGPNWLAAARIDRWLDRLATDDAGPVHQLIGFSEPPGLAEVPGAPMAAAAPAPVGSGYLAQLRDGAPRRLLGRTKELRRLERFCTGDSSDLQPYLWIEGGPWAGKSALAAWFILHPPPGVAVVFFFVARRVRQQADSEAFTEAMLEQLGEAAGETPPAVPGLSADQRDRAMRGLLERAARQVTAAGRRLVMVVDGLDEDDSADRPDPGPSILSLLPRRPPDGVRIVVTARPGLALPSDHPLSEVKPWVLSPSSHARDRQQKATEELDRLLASGDPEWRDLLAFTTLTGGSLTVSDLAAVASLPADQVDHLLSGHFGRTLQRRPSVRPGAGRADAVVSFAHETLRASAEATLGAEVDPYRDRLHGWADTYRRQGWPADTPAYLLRPYGQLLVRTGDAARLVAGATDPARQEQLFRVTFGDVAGTEEIVAAERLLQGGGGPLELAALARLGVHRDHLTARNQAVPVNLPAVWGRLGDVPRAEALAQSCGDPQVRAQALGLLAAAIGAGDPDRAGRLIDEAEAAAGSLAAWVSPVALAYLALAVAGRDPERAGRLSAAAERGAVALEPWTRAQVLTTVISGLSPTQSDRAAGLAGEVRTAAAGLQTVPRLQLQVALAAALGPVDPAAASHLAAEVEPQLGDLPPWMQPDALAALAAALASGPGAGRAAALAERAEAAARGVRLDQRAAALVALVGAWAAADPDRVAEAVARAEATGRALTDPGLRLEALINLATGLSKVAPERTTALLAEVASQVGGLNDRQRPIGLTELSAAYAATGAFHLARQAAASLTDPWRTTAFTRLVRDLAAAGDLDAARQAVADAGPQWVRLPLLGDVIAARARTDPGGAVAEAVAATGTAGQLAPGAARAAALSTLAEAIAPLDRTQAAAWASEAELTARQIGADRVRALAKLIPAVAVFDRDRASGLAAEVEALIDPVTPNPSSMPVSDLVTSLTGAQLWEPAERLIRSSNQGWFVDGPLLELLRALGRAAAWDRVERLATSCREMGNPSSVASTLVEVYVAAGRWSDADAVLATMEDAAARAEGLATVSAALAGDDPRARSTAEQAVALIRAPRPVPAAGFPPVADLEAARWTHALATVVPAVARFDREAATALAEEAAAAPPSPGFALSGPDRLITAWVAVGAPDRAEALLATTSAIDCGPALLALVTALASARRWDDACRALSPGYAPAGRIPAWQVAPARTELVTRLAHAGEWERARPVIDGAELWDQAPMWAALLAEAASAAPARAPVLATAAVATLQTMADGWIRAAAFGDLVPALALVDRAWARRLVDDAERDARSTHPLLVDAVIRLSRPGSGLDRERALALAAEAEQLLQGILDRGARANATNALVVSLATNGDTERAREMAESVQDDHWLADLSARLAAEGQAVMGEQVAARVADPWTRATALAQLAAAVAPTDRRWAARLAGRAGDDAATIARPDQAWVLLRLANGLAPITGGPGPRLVADVAPIVGRVRDRAARAQLTCGLVVARATNRLWDGTVELARQVPYPSARANVLATVAERLLDAEPGPPAPAPAALAEEAEHAAHAVIPEVLGLTLQRFAGAVATMEPAPDGLAALAEELAHLVGEPVAEVRVLSALVHPDRPWGARVAADAARLARSLDAPDQRALALAAAASVTGRVDPAATVEMALEAAQDASAIADPQQHDQTVIGLVTALGGAGAWNIAEQMAYSYPWIRDPLLGTLHVALVAAGQWERAADAGAGITDPVTRVQALAALASALLPVDRDRAAALAGEAAWEAGRLTEPLALGRALAAVAPALAGVHPDQARAVLGRAEDAVAGAIGFGRDQVLGEVIRSAIVCGDIDRVTDLHSAIADPWVSDLVRQCLAGSFADLEAAERLAGTITDPWARAQALVGIGDRLSRDRDHHRDWREGTARLVARVIAEPPWTLAFGLLARIDAGAFGALGTELAAVYRRRP